MPELKIGDLVAKIPIIQGGMGVGVSKSGLAAAVANEGGIGVISSVGLGMIKGQKIIQHREANLNALKEEIRKAKIKSAGIIGVNIMVALSDYDELVKTSLEEGIDIMFLGAGLPIQRPKNISKEFIEKAKTKLVPIVSSARSLKLIVKKWVKNFNRIPDAVVVEGPLAGGHLGFKLEQISDPKYKLEVILAEVIAVIKSFEKEFSKKIPVIAGGGIFNGADIAKFLRLGADGVQMGTRFVATDECDADIEFKNQYLNAKKEDIGIIKSPVGLPGRAIINNYLSDVANGIRQPFNCPWKCLKTCDFKTAPYCIAKALTKAKDGFLGEGFCFAGANAYRVEEIVSVKKLMHTLREEYIKFETGLLNKNIKFSG